MDEQLRAAQRRAKATGEDVGDMAARAEARAGFGLVGYLRESIGEWVYVEGARMNYRGVLTDVFASPAGAPEAVALEPCFRLGWWDKQPKKGYNFKLQGRHVIPWDAVQAIGPPSPRQGGTSEKVEED